MAKRFRLETVLRVRGLREEAASVELAHAQALRRAQERILDGLERDRWRARAARSGLERQGLLACDLLMHLGWEEALGRRSEGEGLRLKEYESACEQRRLELLERRKDRKILERLRERQLRLFRVAEARAEQKVLDEVGGRRAAEREEP